VPHLGLKFEVQSAQAEHAERVCFAAGALAVTLSDARDDAILEPAPGEIRMWPMIRLAALFDATAATPQLLAGVAAKLGVRVGDLQVHSIEDRAWERECLADFHAMRFGRRLWICPRHEACPDPNGVFVQLDPGLAFGTGTHPSTALCLEWLDAATLERCRMIDYGCGSGILSLVAAKLGAAQVYAFDIDPQACLATRENAASNNLATCVHVRESEAQLPRPCDLLIANILSEAHCRLAEHYARLLAPGAQLVLAGILAGQQDEVAAACSAWFDMEPIGARDGWIALGGTKC